MNISTGLGKIAENIAVAYNDRIMSIDELKKETSNLKKETSNMRKGFREDQKKVVADLKANAAEVKANLANGEDVRIGDFKDMMTGIESSIKTIQERRKEISTEVTGLMKVFGTEREQGAAEWNALTSSIRGGGVKPAVLKKTKVVEKTVKRPKIQAEVVKPKIVPEKAEVVKPKPVQAKTVEEKILEYVASHPKKGVKVGEMEGSLGINKMKLGKLSKKLLEQGKLRKEDNKYFPK